jgi:hypothetical protein
MKLVGSWRTAAPDSNVVQESKVISLVFMAMGRLFRLLHCSYPRPLSKCASGGVGVSERDHVGESSPARQSASMFTHTVDNVSK